MPSKVTPIAHQERRHRAKRQAVQQVRVSSEQKHVKREHKLFQDGAQRLRPSRNANKDLRRGLTAAKGEEPKRIAIKHHVAHHGASGVHKRTVR